VAALDTKPSTLATCEAAARPAWQDGEPRTPRVVPPGPWGHVPADALLARPRPHLLSIPPLERRPSRRKRGNVTATRSLSEKKNFPPSLYFPFCGQRQSATVTGVYVASADARSGVFDRTECQIDPVVSRGEGGVDNSPNRSESEF